MRLLDVDRRIVNALLADDPADVPHHLHRVLVLQQVPGEVPGDGLVPAAGRDHEGVHVEVGAATAGTAHGLGNAVLPVGSLAAHAADDVGLAVELRGDAVDERVLVVLHVEAVDLVLVECIQVEVEGIVPRIVVEAGLPGPVPGGLEDRRAAGKQEDLELLCDAAALPGEPQAETGMRHFPVGVVLRKLAGVGHELIQRGRGPGDARQRRSHPGCRREPGSPGPRESRTSCRWK